MTDGIKWDMRFMTWYARRQACEEYPELFIPANAKGHEDQRSQWLTAQNSINLCDQAKQYLIDHDSVIDKPGFIKFFLSLVFQYC